MRKESVLDPLTASCRPTSVVHDMPTLWLRRKFYQESELCRRSVNSVSMALFHSNRSGYRATRQDEGITSAPVTLSTVVVVALSKEAYSTVALNPAVLLETLQSDDRILSQGDIIRLQNSEQQPGFSYRLQLLEPVRQGRAQIGQTEITLLSLVPTPPITLAGNNVQDPIEI